MTTIVSMSLSTKENIHVTKEQPKSQGILESLHQILEHPASSGRYWCQCLVLQKEDINPFIPKREKFQFSPAASPENINTQHEELDFSYCSLLRWKMMPRLTLDRHIGRHTDWHTDRRSLWDTWSGMSTEYLSVNLCPNDNHSFSIRTCVTKDKKPVRGNR